MEDRKIKIIGTIKTLLAGCFWALSGSCGQYLFTYKNVTSNWLVPIRLTLGGLVLVLLLLIKRGKGAFTIWVGRKNIRDLIVFALFGMMMCQYSYFTAIQYSNAGTATVIQYLSPAMVMVLMCFLERRKPRVYEIISVLLAIGGTLLLATHGNLSTLAISPAALAWGLISAVMLLMSTVPPRRIIAEFSAISVTGWGMLIGGIVLVPVLRPWEISVILDGYTLLALGIIILATVVAYTFYLQGIDMIGPTKASLLACIEPVMATIISVVWLKSSFAMMDLLGFIMIISTVVILNLCDSKVEASKEN